jgi:hypothetical protein
MGWDLDALKASCVADEFGWDKELNAPWTYLRQARAA